MPGRNNRLTVMFSATFPKEIRKLAGDFIDPYAYIKIGLPINCTSTPSVVAYTSNMPSLQRAKHPFGRSSNLSMTRIRYQRS